MVLVFGISEATIMLQTIAQSGAGMSGAQSIHANVYVTQPVAKFATAQQREAMLPKIVGGEVKVCFGRLSQGRTCICSWTVTHARLSALGCYYISGQKIWISSAQVASKMILLARKTPIEDVKKLIEGLSLFFIDFDKHAPGLELKRIKKMGGRAVHANKVSFDDYRVPTDSLRGEEGHGFKIVIKLGADILAQPLIVNRFSWASVLNAVCLLEKL